MHQGNAFATSASRGFYIYEYYYDENTQYILAQMYKYAKLRWKNNSYCTINNDDQSLLYFVNGSNIRLVNAFNKEYDSSTLKLYRAYLYSTSNAVSYSATLYTDLYN